MPVTVWLLYRADVRFRDKALFRDEAPSRYELRRRKNGLRGTLIFMALAVVCGVIALVFDSEEVLAISESPLAIGSLFLQPALWLMTVFAYPAPDEGLATQEGANHSRLFQPWNQPSSDFCGGQMIVCYGLFIPALRELSGRELHCINFLWLASGVALLCGAYLRIHKRGPRVNVVIGIVISAAVGDVLLQQ